jgi:sporulation protein YlmC with PRC-barrel domain
MKNEQIYFLVLILFTYFIPGVFAINATSENYTIGMFGSGLQSSNFTENYTGVMFLTTITGTRGAESSTYTTNIGFFENTSYYRTISITSYSISPSSAVVGSTISLSISATNAQAVWAEITSPNSQEQTLTLINDGTVNYLPIPSVVGRYNITFYANSSTGAIASAVSSFTLTSQSVDTTSPGGGGSGTEPCTYNWDCTPWSICAGGKQTRECKNIGTCTGTESKPVEEMNCTEALFDIKLQLNDIKLTENRSLIFNVSMDEVLGAEKIDVHIKYTIINNKNEEIFSQIETISVKGYQSIQKEINEIFFSDGQYTLRVDILYGNLQRAFTEQKFLIKDGKIEEVKKQKLNFLLVFIGGIFILLLIFLIIKKLTRKKKNLIERDLDKGSNLIAEGKTNEARLIYRDLRNIYNPYEDPNKKMYNRIMKFYDKILKSKPLTVFISIIGAITIFLSLLEPNITGGIIGIEEIKNIKGIFIIVIIFILASLIILRKKIRAGLYEIINKKYSSKTILGLQGKKVYTISGDYIGKVGEVILGKNKIESLKINLESKEKIKTRGVIIKYNNVKAIKRIVIIRDFKTKEIKKI